MAHVNRRQWERFAYPAELRLTATGHLLPAKLVDISERGMQIIVPVKLYAGNAIHAELPTPRAALAVTGQVCWVAADRTDGTAQTRAGIAFDPLPVGAEQQLRALASELPGSSVIVQLPGSDDPVRASAVRTEEGLRLSFALPFLREGTILTLQPTEAEAEVARIVRTHVYAGGTGAETRVELLVEPCGETRKRRFVQYDAASVLPPQVVAAPSDSPDTDTVESLTVPKRRVLKNVGYGVSLAAAVWLVTRIAEPSTAEAPMATETHVQASKPIAAPVRQPTPVAPPPVPAAAVVPDTTPTADTTPAALARPIEQSAPRPAATSRSPQVTTFKDTTEIFVPVSGSLAGLVAKLWTDPPAVAVDIPRGTVALPRRRYDLQADGVAGLSVGRPGGVTQLRVYVNSVLSQYEATAAPGGVMIRIKHDLQSPH